MNCGRKALNGARVVLLAALLGLLTPASRAPAQSIVLGEIDYTTNGTPDEEARGVIHNLLIFSLSRLQFGKPKSLTDYIRDCRTSPQIKSNAGCDFPDIFIQLQFAERQNELQISGSVSRKTPSSKLETSDLDSIRVRLRDLTEGLSSVVRNISTILERAKAPAEQVRVIIGCFVADREPSAPRRSRPRLKVPAKAVQSPPSDAQRFSNWLESALNERQGILVSSKAITSTQCASRQGWDAIARAAKAQAILTGRIYPDDRSGFIVRPQIFVTGASRAIDLPVMSIRRTKSGFDIRDAEKVAVTASALLRSPQRDELIKAIADSTELSWFLDRARSHLAASPPAYEAADALLELVAWKTPVDPQIYLMQAGALADRRRYRQAMEILQKGIRNVTERKAALHIALAENTERARDLPGARRVYEDAMAAKILGEEAWLGIARTYLAARPPDRARAMEYAIKATAAKNASAVDAYALAGQIALSGDDLAKAEEYLLQGYKLAPNSIELASQLSTLYERLKAEAARNADSAKVIDYLTRSINVAPTLAKLYDRGREYFDLYKGPNERIKAYHLASNDYMAARAIARREDGVLAQFPWLMPNLIEALIFEGRFAEAKQYSEELFEALGSDAAIRPSTDAREIRIIGAFLNAAAEMLANGSAEKEVYLLENAKLGKDPKSLSPWSFAEMRTYLDEDYGPANKTVAPSEAQARIAIVKQWIDGLDRDSSR